MRSDALDRPRNLDHSMLYLYSASHADPTRVMVLVEQFEHPVTYQSSDVENLADGQVKRQEPNKLLNWVL